MTTIGAIRVSTDALRNWLLSAVVMTVLGLVLIISLYKSFAFEFTPARRSGVSETWPQAADYQRGARGTLVVFLHPQCPCSRATLSQLDRLRLAASEHDVTFHAIFSGDPEMEQEPSSLVKSARGLTGVATHLDSQSASARSFGALTSGEAYLYDAAGNLVYHGGLTPSRGHEGSCPSLDFLNGWLRDKPTSTAPALSGPVFGCELETDPHSS
jgi:hypothetical protein